MLRILFLLLITAQTFIHAKRPQEPNLPYPYVAEEVKFENSSAGITLAGTLTLPRSAGPFTAVILLHGSAPFDRDSTLFGHKPFLVLADHLTRQGIAVLRYDKRSAGKSTGNYETSTVEDFADDAIAALNYLKTRKDIRKIGVIGHSEGGLTACIAASRCTDIAFAILMAAPCVNFEKLILEQEPLLQRVDGIPEEVIEKNHTLRSQVFSVIKQEVNREIAEKNLRMVFENYLKDASPLQKQVAETYYGPIESQLKIFNSIGFRYSYSHEPTSFLKQLKIPVLALNGELDLIVTCNQNLSRIEQTLKEVGHTDYTIMKLPKINHGFQTCKTGSVGECAQIEETMAPSAMNAMSEWILKREKITR